MALLIQAYGARVLVDGVLPGHVTAGLRNLLPPQISLAAPEAQTTADAHITVTRGEQSAFRIVGAGIPLTEAGSEEALLHSLGARLEHAIAVSARTVAFVHAGAVGWRGGAILVPGSSYAGKSTLVAELVRRGAVYYSDEYAVVDPEGRVHSYPRPIRLRQDGRQLRPRGGTEPLAVTLIVATAYRAGSTWTPLILSGARAVLPILDSLVVVRTRPELGLQLAARLAPRVVTLQGQRPEASDVAPSILEFLDDLLDRGVAHIGSQRVQIGLHAAHH